MEDIYTYAFLINFYVIIKVYKWSNGKGTYIDKNVSASSRYEDRLWYKKTNL